MIQRRIHHHHWALLSVGTAAQGSLPLQLDFGGNLITSSNKQMSPTPSKGIPYSPTVSMMVARNVNSSGGPAGSQCLTANAPSHITQKTGMVSIWSWRNLLVASDILASGNSYSLKLEWSRLLCEKPARCSWPTLEICPWERQADPPPTSSP